MSLPRVFLVGAGPGDPGLLTIRAVECLRQADVIYHDRLVPTRLLDFAPSSAERICVDQVTGNHGDRYRDVAPLLIEAARAGKCVVRLKGGDPFLFGRGGEETAALHEAGIPFEIVPAVTAALGAGACAGIPLTHRALASAVVFVTGHEQPGKASSLVDWPLLAKFTGTIAIYMPITRLAEIAAILIENGKPPDTPAAAIRWATTSQQETLVSTLAELPRRVHEANLQSPAIVIVGNVVSLRPELSWFEQRPLFGKRILVTRPRDQSAEMMRQLEHLGATCDVCPILEILQPNDWSPVDGALVQLANYDWLVFTSANGVHAWMKRLRQSGRDLRALGDLKLATIGPVSADALRSYHLEPDLVPKEYRSEALASELQDRVKGKRVLLARADRGRELLHEALSRVAQVEQVVVYRQATVEKLPEDIHRRLREGQYQFVTVTSSNIARGLHGLLDEQARQQIETGTTQLVSISPVTTATIRELGLPAALEAKEFTAAGMLAAIAEHP